MKTIEIADSVRDLVPIELKLLPQLEYKLTKTKNTRDNSAVSKGTSVTGFISVVDVYGKPGVRCVSNEIGLGDFDISYIRTSPVVEVVDATEQALTFKTEGGIYVLEKVGNDRTTN